MIFKKTCGGSGVCHEANQTMPDLFTAPVENALIGKASLYGCNGSGNLVDKSKPIAGSIFMKRITTADCIDRMPMGGPFLDADQTKCVSDWLMSKVQ